jgi:hypothetical protein
VEALGAEGLAKVATIGVGESDIDHEHVRIDGREPFECLGGLSDSFGAEAGVAKASEDQRAEPMVVFDD